MDLGLGGVGDLPSGRAVGHQVVPVIQDAVALHFPQDTGVLVLDGVDVGRRGSAGVQVGGKVVRVEVDVAAK